MPAEYPLAVEVEANHLTDTVQLNCYFSSAFGFSYNGEDFLEKMDAVLSSIVSGESLSLENFNVSQSAVPGSPSAVQWDNNTWSTTESTIREYTMTFCELTSAEVTKGASFLSLGVDSVTAIQFARQLREAGLQVSSADVMRFSCVGALAQHVEYISAQALVNGNDEGDKFDIGISIDIYKEHVRLLAENDSISAMFETTPLQSGMITQTLASAGQVYVYPHPIQLKESVDTTRLKEALLRVITANDILRTSFHLIAELGSSWIGAVHTNPPFEWKEITLPSGADVLLEIGSLYTVNEESSFEVPPIRSILVNQPECRLLVIVLHHALYDGASIPFLFEDLAVCYEGGSPLERPQFSDTVKHILSGQEEACKFWTQRLLGYEATEIPELAESSDRMFLSERRVDLDLSAVVEACKAMEVTVQSVSLLTYAKVLASVVGKRDVVFGQVLAGRSLPVAGAERTLGPLFNTVAQRVTFEPRFLSNKAMAQRLQQLTVDSQGYQHAPLRVVQNSSRQANNMTSSSLFDTLFVFQKSADLAGSVIEEQQIWTPFQTDDYAAQAEYKLNIEVDHARDGLEVRATCNGRYLSQGTLDHLLDEFATVFRDIIEHPTRCATVVPHGLGELPVKLSLEQSLDSEVEAFEAPPHEAIVQSVLADIAGVSVDNITPNTSIFNIGLDSLSAIRIASICRSKGLRTGVADILQGNTLRGISQRIRPMSEQTPQPQGSLIKDYEMVEAIVLQQLDLSKDSIETILPCLGGQFHHLVSWLKSGRTLFEPAWAYFCSERMDSAKMEEAWLQLRQRHPILRTCFAAISSSEAVQVVLKQATHDTNTFKVIQSSTSITEAAQAQAREEALHPSTLFTPPVRLRLLKASDRDGILVLINHAAYDAWTMPMFVTELAQLYRSQAPETNPDFPAFVDFSLRSLQTLNEEKYWTSTLEAATPTIIRNPRPEILSPIPDQLFIGAWEKVKNLSQLENQCRSANLSLQTVVLLAIARCIARLTGVQNPTVGLYQTGRSASFNNIESLSGPCLNVNPFIIPNAHPTSTNTNTDVLTQARAIQSSLAERVSYEQSSLRNVLQWTTSTETPLFNTWVNLLWMQNAIPSQAESTPEDPDDLFLPLRIGVPTDSIPREPLEETVTAVSALDTSFLPMENVFIDVGPDTKTDSIGFGVRVEGGILSEEAVNALVDEIGQEIEMIVGVCSETS